jgi:hypothetical protein
LKPAFLFFNIFGAHFRFNGIYTSAARSMAVTTEVEMAISSKLIGTVQNADHPNRKDDNTMENCKNQQLSIGSSIVNYILMKGLIAFVVVALVRSRVGL